MKSYGLVVTNTLNQVDEANNHEKEDAYRYRGLGIKTRRLGF
jgi:hypothetical protein